MPTPRPAGTTARRWHRASTNELGEDNTHISTLDPDGISLKAIQALDARSAATKADVSKLQEENTTLRKELAELKKALAELVKRQ